jgi:hypothetical protein
MRRRLMMFEEFGQDNRMDQVNQIATAMLEDKNAERINLAKDDVFRVWAYTEKDPKISWPFIDDETRERFHDLLDEEGWSFHFGQGGGLDDRIFAVFYDQDGLLEMLDQEELWDCVDMLKDELGMADPETEEQDYDDSTFFDYFTNEDDEEESGEEIWEDESRREELMLEYILYLLSQR